MLNHFCKKPLWECTQTLAAVAQGRQPADTVITGARLVNVCTAEVQDDIDVAIAEGRIAYVGQSAAHCIGEDTRVIDAAGQVIAPGFLDGHIHVESSMIGAGEYARAVIPHGTVGIYWDPHEVCNVLGLEGVQVMMEDAARTPLKAMVTTPSCVPAVPGFEDTGAAVGPAEIADSMTWDGVVGLGEMMNFPGVLAGTDHAHGELAATLAADKVVTGHYSIPETDQGLNAYVASGVRCCHESTRAEDALAKMRLGQYAQLRYGSAWLDLPNLAAAITETDIDTLFANLISDDTHPHTLVANGHLDYILRKAVECGIDAVRHLLPHGQRAGLHHPGQVRRHRVFGQPGGFERHPRAHRRRRGGRKRRVHLPASAFRIPGVGDPLHAPGARHRTRDVPRGSTHRRRRG